MKSNFKKHESKVKTQKEESKESLTEKEFEEFVIKSGAKGSFMIYRSANKDDEMGIDEL